MPRKLTDDELVAELQACLQQARIELGSDEVLVEIKIGSWYQKDKAKVEFTISPLKGQNAIGPNFGRTVQESRRRTRWDETERMELISPPPVKPRASDDDIPF